MSASEIPSGRAPPENGQHYILQLYVAGATSRSRQAVVNLQTICQAYLGDNYDLEIIDIYQQPERTREQQIIAAPTLLKLSPQPMRRIVGDLSDRLRVLSGLALGTGAPGA